MTTCIFQYHCVSESWSRYCFKADKIWETGITCDWVCGWLVRLKVG